MNDTELVKQDVDDLYQKYMRALADLDETWRLMYFTDNPRRLARLQRKVATLQTAARVLAGRHQLATMALKKLNDIGDDKMILQSELVTMTPAELTAAIETKTDKLDKLSLDLEAMPIDGGSPGQQEHIDNMLAALADGQAELALLNDRLKEIEPPAPAQFSIF